MSDIDEVKSRLNIVDIINTRVPLKKAGRNFRGLCPFHSEKTPSFMVSPERGVWHCFGCGKGGSVIDFIMEYEHVDFVEALENLAEKAGVKLERRAPDSPEAKLKDTIYEINHLASEYYHYILTTHALGDKARAYLKGRGVSDKTIKTFMLGYSPNSWEAITSYLVKKGYNTAQLISAGLLVKSNRGGYDRFRGRVMFTLKDHRGKIVGFSGRSLDPQAKEAKYINTSDTPVYNKSQVLYGLDVTKSAIQKAGEAVVTEGEFDVISSFQAGISNVVAIKGSALTEGHVNLLRRFAEKLVFALDSDLAGDAAARRGIEIADRAGLDMKVVVMPSGKDPDDAVRDNAADFKKAIEKAMPVYDYFIHSALNRFDTSSVYGKKKISSELMPILNSIDNPVIQSHYVKKVAKNLDVTEEVIIEGMKKMVRTGRMEPEKGTQKDIKKSSRLEQLEMFMLSMILQTKTYDFLEELKDEIKISEIHSSPVRQIMTLLSDYLKPDKPFFVRDFAADLSKELLPILDEAFLFDVSDITTSDESTVREWTKAVREYKKLILKGKIQDITTILSEAELSKEDPEANNELALTLNKYTQQLRDLEKSRVL